MSATIIPFRARRPAVAQGIDPAFRAIVEGVLANRDAQRRPLPDHGDLVRRVLQRAKSRRDSRCTGEAG